MNPASEILSYHEATKHHFHRYARSSGYMDWANQPNPFRFYEGAEITPLPLPDPQGADITYAQLHTPGVLPANTLDTLSIGRFLGLSLGLSAWKATGGSRWSLRINPSSGNLHPTEAYLILPAIPGLEGGVYHYNVFQHALEKRIPLPVDIWSALADYFQGPGFLVALCTIFWRESWKYGERAFRYCQLDTGHALAALSYAVRLNGWTLTCLTGAGDDQIAAMLGLDRTPFEVLEADTVDLIAWVAVEKTTETNPRLLPVDLVSKFMPLGVNGQPNRLSGQPVDWPLIYHAGEMTRKPATPPLACHLCDTAIPIAPLQTLKAAEVIRRRRSATAYIPRGTISTDAFLSLLERTVPNKGAPPFDVALTGPNIDLLLFVHRVADFDPGLYFFMRRHQDLAALKAMFNPDFLWQPAHPQLNLWQLARQDVIYEAIEVSCHQEIAGHGALAVAMLTPLAQLVSKKPYLYRHLHWECGQIGQALYLAAEAQGLRGTGIGCFFDDAVTELLGVKKNALNSLYHFTIGYSMEDPRIQTLPAYHHLAR